MSYAIDMVPGTAQEVAAVAFAKMMIRGGGDPARIINAERDLRRAERRELVSAGRLPGSSAYPYSMALGVGMVELGVPTVHYREEDRARLVPPVERALTDTASGAYELWFNQTGDAFLSFEHEGDAVLFRLALDGDGS